MNKKLYTQTMCFIGSMFPIFLLLIHFPICDPPFMLFLACITITTLINIKNKYSKTILLIFSVIVIGYFIFHIDLLDSVFSNIYNALVHVYNRDSSLQFNEFTILNHYLLDANTFLFMCMYHLIIASVVTWLFEKNKKILIIPVLLVSVFPLWIVSIDLYWIAMIVFMAYLFTLLITVHTYDSFVFEVGLKQIAIVFISVCIFLSSILFIFTKEVENSLYMETALFEKIQLSLNEALTSLVNKAQGNEKIDLFDADDRYYRDVVHARVYSDKNKELYIRKNSGAIYEDNAWMPLDDNTYNELHEVYIKSALLKNTNYTIQEKDLFEVRIEDKRVDTSYSLFLYDWNSLNVSYENTYDRLLHYEEDDVVFKVYEDVTKIRFRHDYQYEQFVKKHYLQIPANIIDYFEETLGLDKYVEHKDDYYYYNKEEAISYILDILDEYSYTLRPGATPSDEDFVHYFLNVNEKGYCVHFASAATLMFRYFGIPARFVEGYWVKQPSYEKKDDLYVSNVLDRNAHAWVEVYDAIQGWTPIEVTVGRNIDGQQSAIDEDVVAEEKEEENITDIENERDENIVQNNTNQIDVEQKEKISLGWGMYVVILLLLCFFSVIVRREYRKHLYRKKDRKEVCFALYRHLSMLERYGNAFEPDILFLFEKNKFSRQGITEEELDKIKKFTETRGKEIYNTLSLLNKLKFIYIDCLL